MYERILRRMRQKVRAAMAYPSVMALLAIAVTVFLLTYILPKFEPLFSRKGAKLPTPTIVMMTASNILMDLSHHTYLADFGLARLVSTSTLAFHTGHGTPPYSPPEQIRSKEITPKSDIFSFGILLFEMFTGG